MQSVKQSRKYVWSTWRATPLPFSNNCSVKKERGRGWGNQGLANVTLSLSNTLVSLAGTVTPTWTDTGLLCNTL
ncbi:hypothetical protein XELAEV_18004374mg [Xenopus laevis]|uniref:Uncharacterized protein n=1 Tax=Xenopus laevis TaxID=8355 RepID=A0A974BPH2_XENLA|nr:hypothetical protein XELAEV_18004374mg [Xenopus laevis]